MWAALVDAVREVTAAHPDAAATSARSASAASTRRSSRSTSTLVRSLPMLMWQDQRGTDHSFEIMARDENAFFTFVERHGIPPVGGGLSLAHILYVQHDRPEVHERTAAYVEAMDYVTARLTGRITASQHSTFMYQLCDNRSLDPPALRRRARPARRASTRPACRRLVAIDSAIGTAAARRRARARPSRDRRSCTRARTTPRPPRSRPARSRPGGPASRSVPRACSSTRSTAFRVDLEHQIFSMPGAVPRPLRRVRRERARRQGRSNTCCATSSTRPTSSATTRAADPFAALDPALARHARRRGRRDVPAVARRRAARRRASGAMRGGFVNMSLETTRRDLVRAVVEGVAHNLRCARSRPVEAFTGERDRRDRARRRRGPLRGVVPGARRRPRPPRARARPHPTSRSPAPPRCSRCNAAGAGRAPTSTASRVRASARFEPEPGAPQPVRRSTRTVRSCLRCTSPDQ